MRSTTAVAVTFLVLISMCGCETTGESPSGMVPKSSVVVSSGLRDRFELDGWPVEQLDTARNAEYLSESERDVVLVSNAVRTNPAKFGRLYVHPLTSQFEGTVMGSPGTVGIQTREGARVVRELYDVLIEADPLPVQQPSQGLSQAAADHASDQSRTGEVGHTGSDSSDPFGRMNRYGKWKGSAGENISYGSETGLDIVLQLLIDDGVPSRGHRKNILHQGFQVLGVAIDSHPRFGNVCVLDYASAYTER